MKELELSYSEAIGLVSELKIVTQRISELIKNISEEDYSEIGNNGQVWVGDVANLAHSTFEELASKISKFVELSNNYSDVILKNIEQKNNE